MVTRRPAEVFPPGEFLREELEERGWTQSDLAEILDRPPRLVSEIINGKRGISPETAKGLAAAFGTSAEYWLNLESAYQLSRVQRDDVASVNRRAKIYTAAPVKDMIRRGWIEASQSIEVLEKRVLDFFEVESLDEEPQIFAHAVRKSGSYMDGTSPSQWAWLCRARKLGRAVHVDPFSERSFDALLHGLRPLLHEQQEVRHVPRLLSEAGIRMVIVEMLPNTRIDGACFWLQGSPVVALSLRHDRIDNFWFTLMHELGHVSKRGDSLDVDLDVVDNQSDRPESERLADTFANEHLIPSNKLENFIARTRPLYSVQKISAFALTQGVHPGIVVGQLQHRREIPWANLRRMLVPVRDVVTSAALTDGWGTALPAEL